MTQAVKKIQNITQFLTVIYLLMKIIIKNQTPNSERMNIEALVKALPVSRLEPETLVSVKGLVKKLNEFDWDTSVYLYEPPAGQQVPYVEPSDLLVKFLRHYEFDLEEAQVQAKKAINQMKLDIPDKKWVIFFRFFSPDGNQCISLTELIKWLRIQNLQMETDAGDNNTVSIRISDKLLEFFDQLADSIVTTPLFRGPDHWDGSPLTLEELQQNPPPKAMIEFVPGAPWTEDEDQRITAEHAFFEWRESIRPVALTLEKTLGEPVYYFKDWHDDDDDDCVHRFLVLHWCCTYKPDSEFVRYLLEVSEAENLEELKAALIDPASYTSPFKMHNALFSFETEHYEINYSAG